MKRTVGFRLSGDVRDCLNALAEEWNCTRTDVIEHLVRQHKEFSGKIGEARPNPPPAGEQPLESPNEIADRLYKEEVATAVAHALTPTDGIEVVSAAMPRPAKKNRPDPAKIDAAQRPMAQNMRKR